MPGRVLISVYDKTGLDELLKALAEFNVEIISSGGTARRIRELGYRRLTEVSEYTGHPESPGGLLKTLHPRIHGGLLLKSDIPEHREYMDKHGIMPFEMVVANLYPFEAVIAKGADLRTAAENIDIGGPTMIRSAAKAALLYGSVTVVTDPSDYPMVIKALRENKSNIPASVNRELAEKAFARTSSYDAAIVAYLEKERKRK